MGKCDYKSLCKNNNNCRYAILYMFQIIFYLACFFKYENAVRT